MCRSTSRLREGRACTIGLQSTHKASEGLDVGADRRLHGIVVISRQEERNMPRSIPGDQEEMTYWTVKS